MDQVAITLFLAGDVMAGRGVDQIMAHPSAPELHEPDVTDAREYVRLAEQMSGPLPRAVGSDYVWGDALAEWERLAPAARVINLETSITRSDAHRHLHPRQQSRARLRTRGARRNTRDTRAGEYSIRRRAVELRDREPDQPGTRHRDSSHGTRVALAVHPEEAP
jgi:hypothetical protein